MIRIVDFRKVDSELLTQEHAGNTNFLKPPEAGWCRWVDVTNQTTEDIELLREGFGFHPLALEDCLHFDQRPKLEEFQEPHPHAFVVIHGFAECPAVEPEEPGTLLVSRVSSADGTLSLRLRLEELHAFLGPSYLVTIHQHDIEAVNVLWQRVQQDKRLPQGSCDFLYYLIADHLCDRNFLVLEQISDELDYIEETVLTQPKREILSAIYEIRKVLVTMRRALSPQRDLMALLARHGGNSYISSQASLYFRDVYDHLVRINEAIESGRDLLGNCVDAYLSSVAQRTNEIMKQLTILSAILLPLTFIVGFFGMNFETLIPFGSKPVFISMLVFMFVVLPAGMLYWFHRKKWI